MPARKQKFVLLVNPPIHSIYYRFLACQPVGLLRIGHYLRQQGCRVKMIDCLRDIDCNMSNYFVPEGEKQFVRWETCGNFKGSKLRKKVYFYGIPWEQFRKELAAENPDEIWVGSTMTYYWEGVHQAVKICKEVHPNTKVVVGGIYATLCPGHAKKSGADVVFEGELFPASDCPTALDLLQRKPNYAVLKSTRGCPNNCSYCAVHKLEGNKMRYRPPEAVVAEMEEKMRDYGIRKFIFWESNLLINARNHIEKILDLIIERKIDVSLSAPEGLAPNLIYQRLADKMKKAGFFNISLPMESADDEMCRKRFHRASRLGDLRRAVAMFKKAGFKREDLTIFVLAGMPGQPVDDVLKSFIEVWKLDARILVMPFTPIPGTEEFERHKRLIKNKGLERLNPGLWCFARNNKELLQLEECNFFATDPNYLLTSSGWNKQKTPLIRMIEKRVRDEIKSPGERKKFFANLYSSRSRDRWRIDIRMGYQCNNNCRFCCNEKWRSGEFVGAEKIKGILRGGVHGNRSKVVFTGGEPTIRKDLPELIAFADSLGYRDIQIITNGRMLSYEKYLTCLIDNGLTNVCVSLPAIEEGEFDYLTRVRGSYRQVMQAFGKIKKTNLITQTITPITKRNYAQLPAITEFIAKLAEGMADFGAEFVFINPEGNAWINRQELVPKYSEVQPFVKKALDIAKEKELRLNIEDIPFCLMGEYKKKKVELYLAEYRVYIGPGGVKRDLNQAILAEGKTKGKQCEKCLFWHVCEGVWKNYAKIYGLGELKPVAGRKVCSREEVFLN